VIDGLGATGPGGRNDALNRAALTLGRWIVAGALKQAYVEDQVYAAVVLNGVVGEGGDRQRWATLRSGLGTGLQEPLDFHAHEGTKRTTSE
jgi:putative DNA primase/helicase